MLTYALFIATDPDPVSVSDLSHIDEIFERARLSSGGTIVRVRATEGTGTGAGDFDKSIATFINGIHLEVRDRGPESFTYVGDGVELGTAQLSDGQWLLMRAPAVEVTDAEPIAFVPAEDHPRAEIELRLGRVVSDWLV